MIIPPLKELSAFLGKEPREIHVDCPPHGAQKGFEYLLQFIGSPIVWRVFPALEYCQFLGVDGGDSPIEAFIKCDAIEINHDVEEEGGQCVVMKAKGWHVCITPRKGNQLFFSIYGDSNAPCKK